MLQTAFGRPPEFSRAASSQRTQSLITGDYQLPALTCFLGRPSFLGARRTILWPEAIWTRRRSAQIVERLPWNFCVCSIRYFRTSSTIGSFISRPPLVLRANKSRDMRIPHPQQLVLMTGNHDITAWFGSEITHHGCFNVYSFFHKHNNNTSQEKITGKIPWSLTFWIGVSQLFLVLMVTLPAISRYRSRLCAVPSTPS